METIRVGWVQYPELKEIECHVCERWKSSLDEHDVKSVRYLRMSCGVVMRVVYCHSQNRYVFAD